MSLYAGGHGGNISDMHLGSDSGRCVQSLGPWADARADPVGKGGLIKLARGQGEHRLYDLVLRGVEVQSIEAEEDYRSEEGHSLVPVSERVIRADSECVIGGEPRKVRSLLVGPPLSRSGQS